MKNITIIGASAGVGLATVLKSLEAGHHITTLSRSIKNLPKHPGITVIQGSAINPDVVKKAIEGADAVIVTLGTGTKINGEAIFKGSTLYSDAALVLINALNELKMQVPLVVVTGFGAGDSRKHLSFSLKIIIRVLLRKLYDNKTKMEQIISSKYPNWVIVRPGELTDKPATNHYQVYSKLDEGLKIKAIARADVASFLIKQAEIPTEIGNYVVLMGQ